MLSVTELQEKHIPFIADYWCNSDPAFLEGMGVDLQKLPAREFWFEALQEQLNASYQDKKSYCTVWHIDEQPVGHCNVNKIIFGDSAYMHLHLWSGRVRQKGNGEKLVKMSLPYFFKNLNLKKVFCEPYAHNISPNKTLKKVGFEFKSTYTGTPGFLNYEQEVNLWEISRDKMVPHK